MDRLFPLHKNRSRAGPSELRRASRALCEKLRTLISLIQSAIRVRELLAELKAERAKSAGLESHVDYLKRNAQENDAVLEQYDLECTQLWRVVEEIVTPAFAEGDERRLELLKRELPERFNEAQFLAALQAKGDWSTGP